MNLFLKPWRTVIPLSKFGSDSNILSFVRFCHEISESSFNAKTFGSFTSSGTSSFSPQWLFSIRLTRAPSLSSSATLSWVSQMAAVKIGYYIYVWFKHHFQCYHLCFFATYSSFLASSFFQLFLSNDTRVYPWDKATVQLCTFLSVHQLTNRLAVTSHQQL